MAFFSLFGPKDPQDKDLYEYIHNIFGFYPKNIALYRVAFTHKSMSAEKVGSYHVSNERMEYLGDAVLGTAVADFLFHTYPTQPEGFEDYIRHAPDKSSGQGFKSIGGNAFEALMGAIYLDRGYEFAKSVIVNRIIKVHIDLDELQQTDVNYKSKLLEWSQKNKKKLEFKMLEEIGTGNKKMYHVQIVIDDKAYADALDRSIRGAEQLAAEKTSQVLFKD